MAERNTLRIFKGPSKDQFRQTAEAVAKRYGGLIEWNASPDDDWLHFFVSHNDTIHTALLPYVRDAADYLFCKKLAVELNVPWIQLRIQDGTLWDYSLYSAGKHLSNFSTLPEYWGEDDEWNQTQRGDPQLLATIWGIDRHRIERYLLPWGFQLREEAGTFETTRKGKAYDEDKYPYGDIWQMHDFLRAIGGIDPYDFSINEFQHRIKCPDAESLK
jgi:hypothetical protein